MRTTVGHPEEARMVQKEAVGKPEHAGPKAVDQIALQIELHDRVEVGTCTLVGAAPVQDPEMLSVRVRKHTADGAHHPALWQLFPPEGRAIRIRGGRLRVDGGGHDQRRQDGGNATDSALDQTCTESIRRQHSQFSLAPPCAALADRDETVTHGSLAPGFI